MRKAAERFRVALVQMQSSRDVDENLETAKTLVRDAASKGAVYVQTPENTLLMEAEPDQLFQKVREEQETPALEGFSDLAASLGIWLHIGSIAVKVEARRACNRAFLFAPDGSIAARYDKIHMFDVNLPSGETYRESASYKPGQTAVLAKLPMAAIGITTCYDLRFPEQYKALAKAGASILAVPSAFTKVTGEAHWHVLLRARAIETGCFVLAAAQGGRHANGRSTYGHSLIINPWGEILAEGGTEPCVLTAELDMKAVEEARARIPALAHVRDFELNVVDLEKKYPVAAQ